MEIGHNLVQAKATRRWSIRKDEDSLVEAAVWVSLIGRVKHVFRLDRGGYDRLRHFVTFGKEHTTTRTLLRELIELFVFAESCSCRVGTRVLCTGAVRWRCGSTTG